ncbi:hypothetical protein GWI33_017585 [Rhynchophorus ferrugineus]|uniref:PH domain-containing protein n=1 Tax=Rhynchophorus ferrugineus TaxID=354439 RepID=A0A834I915_RHYFE|nr:hypothetical protein GWI33_017585 [Rhynchophorus ferrugineus]
MNFLREKPVQLNKVPLLDSLSAHCECLSLSSPEMSLSKLSIDSADLTEFALEPAEISRTSKGESFSRQLLANLLNSKKKKPLLKASKDFYVPHAENTVTKDTKKVADVVHDLVLEKYQKRCKNLLKKLRKNELTEVDERYIDVVNHLKQSFEPKNDDLPRSVSEDPIVGYSKTFDMSIVQETDSFQVKSHYESVHFDDRPLTSAYDDRRTSGQVHEIYVEPTTSMNSSDISYLLSMPSDTVLNLSRKRNSAINRSEANSLYNVVNIKNEDSYECITNLYEDVPIRNDIARIKHEIFVQEDTARQLYNLMRHGRKRLDGFIGTTEHFEAERMLVLANAKLQTFMELLYSGNSTTGQTTADITVGNLRCVIEDEDPNNYLTRSYYMLILCYEDTVYATNIVKPNRLGWMDFNGPYTFKNLTSIFRIKVDLYRLEINTPSTTTCGSFFRSKIPKAPMMELVGETIIDQRNSALGTFMFHSCGEASIKVTAAVRIKIRWPEVHRGFLTIGTEKAGQQVLWNRRWCVLKKYSISSFTFPCEEEFGQSLGTISLVNCVSCDEAKHLYPKKKSLVLRTKDGETEKIIYATPDTEKELRLWKERVDLVMRGLANWHITDVDQYTS